MEFSDEQKEQYNRMKKAWSDMCNGDDRDTLSFEYHLIYKELCGKSWKECLAPTTRSETLKYLYFGGPKKFFKEFTSEEVIGDIIDTIKTERGAL